MDFMKIALSILIALSFAACLITAIVAFAYSFIFSIRMMFQFKEKGVAYSTATLWNPMNALFTTRRPPAFSSGAI